MPAPANRPPRPRKPAGAPAAPAVEAAELDGAMDATLEIVSDLIRYASPEGARWAVTPLITRWLDAMDAREPAAFGGRDPEAALHAILSGKPAGRALENA